MYTLLTTIFDDMSRTPQKFGEEKNVAHHAIISKQLQPKKQGIRAATAEDDDLGLAHTSKIC